MWDSAFISLVWKNHDLKTSQEIVRSVLRGQKADGRIPLAVNAFGSSKITQPPVLAWAVVQLLTAESLDFAQEVYPKLKKSHEWLRSHRRFKNGLYYWKHPYESGVDNSPRFSNRDESEFKDVKDLMAVDLASYMVLDAEALEKMASLLNLNQDASEFQQEAFELRGLIQSLLWDPETQRFDDRWLSGQFNHVHSLMAYLPLVAGAGTSEQTQKMIQDLADPAQFQTKIPFPTIARNSPNFEKDCWRGPVWVNMAYLMIQGLHRAGAHEQARASAYHLADGVLATWQNTHSFVEFYDPDRLDQKKLSRKRATGLFGIFFGSWNLWEALEYMIGKEIYLGLKPVSHFVGWTGLVETIIQDENLEEARGNSN